MCFCAIFNEDCLTTLSELPCESVDLVVTSPPYDNLRTYNGYSFDFEKTSQGLFKIVKQGGVVVWVVGDATVKGSETGTSFKQALYFKELGFNLHDTMIYETFKPPQSTNRYHNVWEYMFIFSKGRPKSFNVLRTTSSKKGQHNIAASRYTVDGNLCTLGAYTVSDEKIRTNIWIYYNGYKGKNKQTSHPAVFPYQLAEDHILSWSNENDVIYDPFMGSGTTAEAALRNNRHVIGSEISSEYYEIIMNRVKDFV